MVAALGKRLGGQGQVVLDAELEEMLLSAVEDLQHLADDLQETSRLERGKVTLDPGPCDLRAAVEAARAQMRTSTALHADDVPAVAGPWDNKRLARTIAGFAESVNRAGDGSGVATLACALKPGAVEITFLSGAPGGAPRPLGSEAGYPFFRGRQVVLALGGTVDCERSERHCRVTACLPLG
jgi:hypothetical protein